MKKVVSFLVVLTFLVVASSYVFATDFGVKTASATFQDTANLDVKLYAHVAGKDFETDYTEEATEISFKTEDVDLGSTEDKWVVGTVFAKLSSNLVGFAADSVKVYIHTNNQANTTADYRAKAPTPGEYALYRGLIRRGNTDEYKAGDHAEIDLLCVEISSANAYYKDALPTSFPMNETAYASYLGHKVLFDVKDSTYAGADEWCKLIAKSGQEDKGGIWIGSGSTDNVWWDKYSGTNDVIMFFGATFNTVVSGDSFATESIKFTTDIE